MKFIALLFTILSSCCAVKQHAYTATSTAEYEYINTVRLMVACTHGAHVGTGVIMSYKYVLTAKHVATCGEGQEPPLVIMAFDLNRKQFPMKINLHSPTQDVTRLEIKGDAKFKTYARFNFEGNQPIGEPVCTVGGDDVTFMVRKCGELTPSSESYLYSTIPIVPGNSGSGLWDATGAVIGINVRGRWNPVGEKITLTVPITLVMDLFTDIYPTQHL